MKIENSLVIECEKKIEENLSQWDTQGEGQLPSLKKLSDWLGVSVPTVAKSLHKLEKKRPYSHFPKTSTKLSLPNRKAPKLKTGVSF